MDAETRRKFESFFVVHCVEHQPCVQRRLRGEMCFKSIYLELQSAHVPALPAQHHFEEVQQSQALLFCIIDALDGVGNSVYLKQHISDTVSWMKIVRKRSTDPARPRFANGAIENIVSKDLAKGIRSSEVPSTENTPGHSTLCFALTISLSQILPQRLLRVLTM